MKGTVSLVSPGRRVTCRRSCMFPISASSRSSPGPVPSAGLSPHTMLAKLHVNEHSPCSFRPAAGQASVKPFCLFGPNMPCSELPLSFVFLPRAASLGATADRILEPFYIRTLGSPISSSSISLFFPASFLLASILTFL